MTKLEKELNKALKNLKKVNEDLTLKRNLEKIQTESVEILRSINGLARTKLNHEESANGEGYYDPGKYDTAYYYVEEMSEYDIKKTSNFEPSFMYECPNCKKKTPVLMSYEQTCDSVELDVWMKRAFIICCGKLQELEKIMRAYRF